MYDKVYRNYTHTSTLPKLASRLESNTELTKASSTGNNVPVPVSSGQTKKLSSNSTQRLCYEPTAYEIPSNSLGQDSVESDHVYAVLDGPVND